MGIGRMVASMGRFGSLLLVLVFVAGCKTEPTGISPRDLVWRQQTEAVAADTGTSEKPDYEPGSRRFHDVRLVMYWPAIPARFSEDENVLRVSLPSPGNEHADAAILRIERLPRATFESRQRVNAKDPWAAWMLASHPETAECRRAPGDPWVFIRRDVPCDEKELLVIEAKLNTKLLADDQVTLFRKAVDSVTPE